VLFTDVVVAGGGVAGLLIAGALAPRVSVVLIEQTDELPRNKYWLTDEAAATAVPDLQHCIESRYSFLDFVAYDGLTASVRGRYCLWDTDRLIGHLDQRLRRSGAEVLTGHRIYTVSSTRDSILVRANEKTIRARLLIDCMGFGSPLATAKGVVDISGYYILSGRIVTTDGSLRPVALDNVMINRRPTFFELFPTSSGKAHAALILPARHHRPDRSLDRDLHFILTKSHYAEHLTVDPQPARTYFGIIPVGRLRKTALDRVVFFGEAGQANPATSATGLSRMLHTLSPLADALSEALRLDRLEEGSLRHMMPEYMSNMNRAFQECVFESLLSFNSDDFRRLVMDLAALPDDIVNDLVFAQFDFAGHRSLPLALTAALRPKGVLNRSVLKSLVRWCASRLSVRP
jgi:flavin-dependent dehydrogenase